MGNKKIVHTSPNLEKILGPVVQKVENAIHQINHYPADNKISHQGLVEELF